MKKYLLLLIIIYVPSLLFAQGELDEQETIFYNDERTWGLTLGTSGLGINFRHGRRINAFKKRLWAIDMAGLRHPKKYSFQNPLSPASFFVYGKLNSIVNFRFSYGQQREIFRKIDKGGIAIRWYYLGGVAVAWEKPIYYEVAADGFFTEVRKFSDKDSPLDILGKASYFKGFSESSFVPGGYLNVGLSFDYSTKHDRVYALEVGASADIFAWPVEIMATDNPFYYVQIYATLRFGKIVDRMKVRLRRTRREMEKKAKD